MTVKLLYFAWVRERIGQAEEELELAAAEPLALLLDRLASHSPGHAAAFTDRNRLRAAVNQDFVDWDTLINSGDEIAIFPPVTGG